MFEVQRCCGIFQQTGRARHIHVSTIRPIVRNKRAPSEAFIDISITSFSRLCFSIINLVFEFAMKRAASNQRNSRCASFAHLLVVDYCQHILYIQCQNLFWAIVRSETAHASAWWCRNLYLVARETRKPSLSSQFSPALFIFPPTYRLPGF